MNDFIKSRPQRLCKMCGACCKMATTPKTHKELLKEASAGNKDAQDFLKLFEPYSSTDEARKVLPQVVDNILNSIAISENPDKEVTFYKCRYIQDNNLCGIYENRLELCDRFPSTAWAIIPPGCGFEGWLFQKREEIKKRIRKNKELKIEFETQLITEQNPEIIAKLKKGINKVDSIIQMLAKYGAENW